MSESFWKKNKRNLSKKSSQKIPQNCLLQHVRAIFELNAESRRFAPARQLDLKHFSVMNLIKTTFKTILKENESCFQNTLRNIAPNIRKTLWMKSLAQWTCAPKPPKTYLGSKNPTSFRFDTTYLDVLDALNHEKAMIHNTLFDLRIIFEIQQFDHLK